MVSRIQLALTAILTTARLLSADAVNPGDDFSTPTDWHASRDCTMSVADGKVVIQAPQDRVGSIRRTFEVDTRQFPLLEAKVDDNVRYL